MKHFSHRVRGQAALTKTQETLGRVEMELARAAFDAALWRNERDIIANSMRNVASTLAARAQPDVAAAEGATIRERLKAANTQLGLA